MHAMTVPSPGGPDALVWTEVPDPMVRPGTVLLHVAATAVNRADIMQRQGHYPPPPGVPEWPGLECSGVIEAVGEGVSGWAPRDEVCALLAGGGYAERVVVPAGQLLPVPSGVDLVTAAALPEIFCTVWSNVFLTASLQPGETLLVHGGASGVGTAAIQLAKSIGANIAVTAGSADKLERCAELGASTLINYREDDFVAAVRDATDGRGANVILDIIGAKYLAQNIDALAVGGRLVIIGLQGGWRAEIDLSAVMGKRAAVIGTTLRGRSTDEKATIVAAVREHVWPLIETGDVRPIIDSVLPITNAAEAHQRVEASEHVGKVIMRVSD